MATLIGNNKPSMMAFPSALNRMGTFPIDISSVWYSYDEAVAYATQTNFTPKYEGQTGLPYVGQILTVVETADDGTTSVTAYSIQNEAGDLAQVGTVTLGDNATIVRDEETGALSLYGIDELTWKETVKDAEGNETEKDVTTYQPKLVKKDGKVVLTWEVPSTITVEGLSTRIQTAEEQVEQLGKDVDAVEKDLADNYYNKDSVDGFVTELEGTIGNVSTNLTNNYYTKTEVDGIEEGLEQAIADAIDGLSDDYYNKEEINEKLTSVFKFQGVKTYKSELPTTGQVVGDVWLVIYDGDAPAEGETNTLPVSNSEYVWTSENKWENLGDDIVDLTNYYTKEEINDIVEPLGKVESVAAGESAWSLKATDKDGTEHVINLNTTIASADTLGLVKSGKDVSIDTTGLITVNEAAHAATATTASEAARATNADYATSAVNAQNAINATHAAIADSATEAEHAKNADDALRAKNAEKADEATKVTNKLSVKVDAANTVEFDGSEAKSVDLSVYAKSADVANTYVTQGAYSTNDEAVRGLITEAKNAADAAQGTADANAEAITALQEKDTEFTNSIGELNTQVGNANKTANEAKDAAQGAIDIANPAKEKAEQALSTANEVGAQFAGVKSNAEYAVNQAGIAVNTSNSALNTATDAGITAGQAKTVAEQALENSQFANNTANANTASITALQQADAGFTTSIEALNKTDLKHTEDISKNATDIAGHAGILTSHGERLSTVEGKVSTLEGTVSNLTGAFKFKGEVESNPTAEGFDVSAYADGDVVIFGLKEYVFTNGKFIEFGDEGSYLTKTTAEADYLKKADAANTYAPKSDFETLRDTTVPAAAKTAEWASVSGKPALSHVETKEETFSSSKVIEVTSGKIRNIEVYDANGEQVIVEVVRNSASKYTLNAVGSTETLTVVYDIVTDIA